MGRNAPDIIGVAFGDALGIPSLQALSGGQSTLLGIFGTILRYGDTQGILVPQNISGICVVDEIDAHMHVDLQFRALPALIQMFPNVQFITSSHSPLFVLGMEKTFGSGGVAIFDMPSGKTIQAENYFEFGRALTVLKETNAFAAAMEEAAENSGKLLVLLEGETDPIYLRTAAALLGRVNILDVMDFEWVGAKDPRGGQGFNTGKDALNRTFAVLRAKPGLVNRKIILLYDNDSNKVSENHDNIYIRMMPTNSENSVVECGIENLLPPEAITQEMFSTHVNKKRNGEKITTVSLEKMKLCKFLCDEKRSPSDFIRFGDVLNMIGDVLKTGD